MPPVRRLVVSLVTVAGLVLASGCTVSFPDPPTNVTGTSATLNARVYTDFGGPVTYWFKYGETTAYGSETVHRTVDMEAGSSRSVSEPIGGLSINTEYHWQVCSQDQQEDPPRVVCSGDRSFAAGPVSCGAITRSIWVTNNLANCAPSIGADDITVNVNGHSFGGAIQNHGFDRVTIENGTAEGVHLTDAANNRILHMTVVTPPGSTSNGIQILGDSAGTLIADNDTFAYGIALNVNASGIHVLRNVASGYGLTTSDKEGPLFVLGHDNRIEGNSARLLHIDGFGRGVGVASIVVYGDRNLLLNNMANDGYLTGIVVDSTAAGTILRGNFAVSNGQEVFGDGIRVDTTSASLEDNTANSNAGRGISAPTGVTDLGGNSAQGNGLSPECTGVVCE